MPRRKKPDYCYHDQFGDDRKKRFEGEEWDYAETCPNPKLAREYMDRYKYNHHFKHRREKVFVEGVGTVYRIYRKRDPSPKVRYHSIFKGKIWFGSKDIRKFLKRGYVFQINEKNKMVEIYRREVVKTKKRR